MANFIGIHHENGNEKSQATSLHRIKRSKSTHQITMDSEGGPQNPQAPPWGRVLEGHCKQSSKAGGCKWRQQTSAGTLATQMPVPSALAGDQGNRLCRPHFRPSGVCPTGSPELRDTVVFKVRIQCQLPQPQGSGEEVEDGLAGVPSWWKGQ